MLVLSQTQTDVETALTALTLVIPDTCTADCTGFQTAWQVRPRSIGDRRRKTVADPGMPWLSAAVPSERNDGPPDDLHVRHDLHHPAHDLHHLSHGEHGRDRCGDTGGRLGE